LAKSRPYRCYLICQATAPLILLRWPVPQVQLAFGLTGAMLLPLLALTLLMMNNKHAWVGEEFRSGLFINAVLAIGLAFFGYMGLREIRQLLSW
jgi:hypothetical protein